MGISRVRLLSSGVFANWAAFAAAIITALAVSPLIVHRLGNVANGMWVLANSSIAYLALLDLGMRGAVTHFVARHHAKGEHIEASRAVSAALSFRFIFGIAIIAISIFFSLAARRIFQIPVNMWDAARWAIILIGLNLAFTLGVGVFGAVLTALNRFDLLSVVAIVQTLVSAAGIVWVLESGHGIVALALVQLIVSLCANFVTIVLSFRVYPNLQVTIRYLDFEVLRPFWKYSFYAFVIAITGRIIDYTDNVVVGAFVTAEAVTFFSIGGRLILYLTELGASLSYTVMPIASQLAAQNRQNQLGRLLIQGTRACLLICLPVGLALFIRGPTFIRLWMGAQYAQPSGQILRILLISAIAAAVNGVAASIVFGLGKLRPFAVWRSCEAIVNLALSIYLVRKIGVIGVAWGTVIPGLISQFIIWPLYVTRLVGLKVGTFLWQGWMRPALATAPFCAACIWSARHWSADNLGHFFLQIAAIVPAVPLGVALFFWKEVNWQLRSEESLLRRTFLANVDRSS